MKQTELKKYVNEINDIYIKGNATEHSFRGSLRNLFQKLTNLYIINEAKRIDCGTPDLTIYKNEIPIGYVEAKNVDKNINDKKYSEQFTKYKNALDNIIITNHLTFQLFKGEELLTEITIGKIIGDNIKPIKENFDAFIEMIEIFLGNNGKFIINSNELAKFMAAKTQVLAEVIKETINNEPESTTLNQQLKSFQEVLLSTMTPLQFADVYAQTITYGMFVAKLQSNSLTIFTRQKAAELIPVSNPFIRKLFQDIAGYDMDENIKWIVDSLADMFNYVNIDKIKIEFESKNKDPFLHFYEDFLTHYDKNIKTIRGAYYTPQSVVKFIVNAVDDILINDFGIKMGLADKSKINTKINNDNVELHKVQILDPATGTGTFLAQIIRNIYKKYANNKGIWNDYVEEHLIPRLNGFEIMMAPYTMAHLKIEMILQELGYNKISNKNKRLKIYLTDTLGDIKGNIPELPFAKWLSDEANEAENIKRNVPVMVILGNPPYNVNSLNKGKWIEKLMNNYKEGLKERNIQPLSDDYLKFICFGQHFIDKNNEGILAYISNNSFIDGLIHRQMRKSLMQFFDKIYILDLHGNTRKKEKAPDGSKDENVFDIMQGVSINIFVRTKTKKENKLAEVFNYNIYGKRQEKYDFLLENNLQTTKWTELQPQAPNYFFVPKDFSLQKEYEKGFKITDLFKEYLSGVKTHNDNELVGFKPFAENNQKYNYRPLDVRFLNYDKEKVVRHRYTLMQHFIKYKNVGLICSRQCFSDWRYVFITNKISDSCILEGWSTIFPLYLFKDDFNKTEKILNMNESILAKFYSAESELHPEQILDYIYAVLHIPSYRTKYKDFLKIDFPRIPYPKNSEQFTKLVEFGTKLRKLHLIEEVEIPFDFANYPIEGSNKVATAKYICNKIYINDVQYFDKVSEEIYNFYIGGYQPCQKWLKDRKNNILTFDDITYYQKIIYIISETIRIMSLLDCVVNKF